MEKYGNNLEPPLKPVNNYSFTNKYEHSMDEKRRVSIPSKMREQLGDRAFVTRWAENCLVLYPMDVWERVEEWLQEMSPTKKEARALNRVMLPHGSKVSFDKLGRVLIPKHLADYAGLDKDVIIAGVGRQVEIWSKKRWDKYQKSHEKSMDEILESLDEASV